MINVLNNTNIMYFKRKLKPVGFPKELLLPFIMLPPFIILIKIAGPQAAFLYFLPFAIAICLITFLIYQRAGNTGHILVCITYILLSLMAILFVIYGKGVSKPLMGFLIVCLAILMPIIIYMAWTRKMKWRKREMLELAAMSVETSESGFTERPFPAGKIEYIPEVMKGFIVFLRTRLIALPVYEENRTIFVMNDSYKFTMGFSNEYHDKTWVSVDIEGQVLVHLAHKDYMLYREQYNFDKLCENLGKVFVDFYQLYEKGEGMRIMDILNDLRLHPITEG